MLSYHIFLSALSSLGCCYLKMKNLEDAEKMFRKHIELTREYAGVAVGADTACGMLLLIYSYS